jgi:hypothetical protein
MLVKIYKVEGMPEFQFVKIKSPFDNETPIIPQKQIKDDDGGESFEESTTDVDSRGESIVKEAIERH